MENSTEMPGRQMFMEDGPQATFEGWRNSMRKSGHDIPGEWEDLTDDERKAWETAAHRACTLTLIGTLMDMAATKS